MNFKKAAPILALLVTTSFMGGCNHPSSTTQENASIQLQVQNQVYTVKVENINGQTITAVQGELVQSGPPALPAGEMANGDQPPALPTGEATDRNQPPALPATGEISNGNQPPALPEGDKGAGTDMTFNESGENISFTVDEKTQITIEMLQGTQVGTLDSIGANDVLEVILDENGTAKNITVKNLQSGSGFGGSHEVTQGTSANTIDEDTEITSKTYSSTGNDENALRIDHAKVTLNDLTVEKLQGESSNTENGDFYGQNAGLLATNGAEVTIKNAAINTSVTNGNGVFSYGEGTVVNISDSKIQTSASNSGGIQTTGGATMNAARLQVETKGNSAAAIRSDRGGGIVKVTAGNYTTNGTGSPAIYSTADISVSDATLTANKSEALVIEGKNSIALKNCTVTGNMDSSHLDETENVHNIMIYQSMSGDAVIGHSTFTAEGGSITAKQGDMIYVTNTTCTVKLSNVKLKLATDILLNVSGNTSSRGWGTQGSNGGDCTFNATSQILNGKIKVDDISSLDITLEQSSTFTGSINEENSSGNIKLTLDQTSKWILSGDSYVSELNGELSQVDLNGFKLYINGEITK